MVLRDGPRAVREAGVEALLVDEADTGGNVAEHLGLPWVSVALFPPLIADDRVPPFCFGWPAGQDALSRLRNRLGMRMLSRMAAPILRVLNEQRRTWGLRELERSTDLLSPLAQIAQLPRALEFDLPDLPTILHYTGPFVDPVARAAVDFPWERLDGRPLVYASLGTLQNGSGENFRILAEGCAGLDAQLVISLGGGLDPAQVGRLDGNPVVVRYAPQLDLLRRAAAVITHAGLNTTLESLAEGLPLVCIPLGNDQPGVAARVVAKGAGVAIPRRKLTAARVRAAVRAVLDEPQYGAAARRLQAAMAEVDGPERAADIIEKTLRIQSVSRSPAVSSFVAHPPGHATAARL
jgi:MGT family glycosyltransferase